MHIALCNEYGTWTMCTAWLTWLAKDRRVSMKDPQVSAKDRQVPQDLHLMLWRPQLCLTSCGKGVFTETCRLSGEGSSEPRSITASQRMKEFPEECLEVTGARKLKLFCKTCREELSIKDIILLSLTYHPWSTRLETDCFVQCHILRFLNYCFDIVLQQE